MHNYRNVQSITHALCGVWRGRYGLAPCPAHDDRLGWFIPFQWK